MPLADIPLNIGQRKFFKYKETNKKRILEHQERRSNRERGEIWVQTIDYPLPHEFLNHFWWLEKTITLSDTQHNDNLQWGRFLLFAHSDKMLILVNTNRLIRFRVIHRATTAKTIQSINTKKKHYQSINMDF